jgi:hypothetical protein
MKPVILNTPAAALKIPKAQAIERITRHLAELRAQLEVAQAQLKAGVSPGKFLLNLQVNALKKQVHTCKAHLARIQKEPRTEVVWPDKLGA